MEMRDARTHDDKSEAGIASRVLWHDFAVASSDGIKSRSANSICAVSARHQTEPFPVLIRLTLQPFGLGV